MEFREFLITEQKSYFSHRLGDILTVVHELISAGKQVGARHLLLYSQDIMSQVRKVIHTSWPKKYFKYLKALQKCGVALGRTIDEKGDLRDTLQSVSTEFERILHKLGTPINDLGTEKEAQEEPKSRLEKAPGNDTEPQVS